MGHDDKTARGGERARPGMRVTAPAGTPIRRSPEDPFVPPPYPSQEPRLTPARIPSDRPKDTLSPLRTVGGQTARLNIPDDEVEVELPPPSEPPGPVAGPAREPGFVPELSGPFEP